MARLRFALLLLLLLAFPCAAAAPPARTDWVGDPLPPAAALRLGSTRLRHLAAADANGKKLGVPRGPRHPVVSVAFSPDGNLAACGSAGDRAVFLWGVASGAQLRKMGLDCTTASQWCGRHDASALFFAPDGKTAASCSCDGVIHLWELETGKQRSFPVGERWVSGVAFAPDGKKLAALYSENGVRTVLGLYDLAAGKELRQVLPFGGKRLDGRHVALAFSPDGKALALGAVPEGLGRPREKPKEDTIYLFDAATGIERRKFRPAERAPTALAFSADGKLLAVASTADQPVEIWDAVTGEEVCKLRGREQWGNWGELTPLAFAPDGKTLATGAKNQVVLWDVATGKEVRLLKGHAGPVRCLAFSPDGKSLLSGSADTTVLLWKLLPPGKQGRLEEKELGRLWADLADADSVVAHAALWKLAAAPEAVAFLEKRLRPAEALDTKKVPKLIADLGAGRPAVRAEAARELKKFGVLARPALFAALRGKLSLEARQQVELALEAIEGPGPSGEAQQLRAIQVLERIADPAAEKLLRSLTSGAPDRAQTTDAAAAVLRLKARRRLVAVRVRTDAELEAARRPRVGSREPRPLQGHADAVTALLFSADGKLLLSAGLDGAMVLRRADTDKERMRFKDNKGVFGAALSPDGKLLASAGADGRVRLWSTSNGRPVRQLPGHAKAAFCVAFSPDGKVLASGGGDGLVRLWAVRDGRPVSTFKALPAKVTSLAFAPDGKSLAVAGLSTQSDNFAGGVTFTAPDHAQFWDLEAGKGRKLAVRGSQVAFTPDGFELVVSGRLTLIGRNPGGPAFIQVDEEAIYNATRITWWDLRRDRELRLVERKGGAAVVSADGELAASCNGFEGHYGVMRWGTNVIGAGPEPGQAVCLWDNRSGQELLVGARKEATAVALSPDGRLLAWGDEKGGVTLWDLTPQDALAGYRGGPGPKDLEALWEDLGAEPGKAFQAAWTLAAARPTAWLAKRVRPVPPADRKRAPKLIADLESDRFAVREAATRELEKLGAAAEPALLRAKEGKMSLEAVRRIEGLLNRLARRALPPEELRRLRVVRVLERIGSPEAVRTLEALARGEPAAAATREARAALARLKTGAVGFESGAP
jgi:WD40 repeat protein